MSTSAKKTTKKPAAKTAKPAKAAKPDKAVAAKPAKASAPVAKPAKAKSAAKPSSPASTLDWSAAIKKAAGEKAAPHQWPGGGDSWKRRKA